MSAHRCTPVENSGGLWSYVKFQGGVSYFWVLDFYCFLNQKLNTFLVTGFLFYTPLSYFLYTIFRPQCASVFAPSFKLYFRNRFISCQVLSVGYVGFAFVTLVSITITQKIKKQKHHSSWKTFFTSKCTLGLK